MDDIQGESAEKAKEYTKAKYKLALASLVIGLAYLVLMILYGSGPLKKMCLNISRGTYLLIALYSLFFFLIYDVLNLPVDIYNGYILEKKYRLSRQGIGGWAVDELKKFTISIIFLVIIVEVIYLFLRNFEYWWIFAGIFWFILTIFIGRIAPDLILPLFYRKTRIEDKDMLERFKKLIPNNIFAIKGIYKVDFSKKTRKANAALAGLGSTKQVILSDTLINNFTPEEIDFVFAHEIAHYLRAHIWKLILMGLVIATIAFAVAGKVLSESVAILGFEGVSDIAAFPLLCLVIILIGLIAMPVQNAIGRLFERMSDAYALVRTKNPDAAISMFVKLARLNLADENPNRLIEFLFCDHPSILKRIKMAYKYKKKLKNNKVLPGG